ncbi:MAG TPA: hypothetical protein VM029_10810 [Opitutaceae bacterium]|nr:hypothetical protein [Opitutaceae bacterium]
MNLRHLTCLALVAAALPARGAEEVFDRIEDALSWSAADARVRTRVSGLMDLEGYSFQQPVEALVHTNSHALFSPRLSVFFDAQLGAGIYLFAQARADRGFDPSDDGAQVRLDEYAVRVTPWKDGRFNVQVGKFATVVGNWVSRHASWSNPFITAPLAYENLTGVWDAEALRSSNTLLQWSHVRPGLPANITAQEKFLRIPVIWGPSYALGAAVSGEVMRMQYAFEVKHASLSSRPEAWSHADAWSHPTVSGRLGYRAGQAWNIGVSASTGTYLRPFAQRTVPARRAFGDFRQVVFGQDVSFAWHHLQVWSEIYAARFEIPGVGDADTLAYYAEAKYKFTPQFSAALRWNRQLFDTISDRAGPTRWGPNLWRIDFAPAYRFTPHTQAKLQYSLQKATVGARDYSQLVAMQLTVRF